MLVNLPNLSYLKIYLIISFFIILPTNSSVAIQQKDLWVYVHRIEQFNIYEDYGKALDLIDSLVSEVEGDDWALMMLLRASTLCARLMDYEDLEDAPQIKSLCEAVENYYKDKNLNIDSTGFRNFYIGLVYLYQALVEQRSGNLINALKLSHRGAGYLEVAININPQLWDAYYGLGLFYYNFSRSAGIVRSMGIVRDRRPKGIEFLKIAAEKGNLTKYSALNALVWIDLENKNYDSALAKCKVLLDEFHPNRASLWLLCKILVRAGRWEEALDALERLGSAIKVQTRNNHYNDITYLNLLAKVYYNLGRWQEVYQTANEALSLPLSKYVRTKKRNDLNELIYLKKRALENLKRKEVIINSHSTPK